MNRDFEKNSPLVSVFMLTYNHVNYIRAAIQSVVEQKTSFDFELVIADDASTDGTSAICEEMARLHPGIVRYFRHKNNIGAAANGRFARGKCRGKYFARLEGDDCMLGCSRLEEQAMWLEDHPDYSMSAGKARIIDYKGQHWGIIPDQDVVAGGFGLERMLEQNLIPACTAFYRADLFSKMPDWIDKVKYGDYVFNIVAASYGKIYFIDKLIGVYRRHSGGMTWGESQEDNLHELIKLYVLLLENKNLTEDGMRWAKRSLSEKAFYLSKIYLDDNRSHDLGGLCSEIAPYIDSSVPKKNFEFLSIDCRAFIELFERQNPYVSVILTTYNRPNLLVHALKSLESQLFKRFEVILINDGGQGVEGCLEGYDFPITYIRLGVNGGLSAARNAGLHLAKGRYVSYLDDDDIYLPTHLRNLVATFEHHPDSLVYTDVVYIQERLENDNRVEVGRSFPTAHGVFDRDKLFIQNYIPVNTWAHPRAAIAKVGNFDTTLTAFEDWDMLLRLVQSYPVHRVEEVTAEVRQRVSGGADHMLARERGRLLPLYRKLYARYPETGNDRVQKGRQTLLTGQTYQDKPWGVAEWIANRTPSEARILAIQTMLGANPDVGTLGVAVIVPDGMHVQLLISTLESLGVQHRPVDAIWLIGRSIPDEVAGDTIELLKDDVHWTAQLSSRIAKGGAPDFLWLLHVGDRLVPHATLTMGEYRMRQPEPLVWYADEAVLDAAGRPANPMLKPDFNIDLLRSYPYIGRNLVISTAVIEAAGGLEQRLDDLALIDLIWRLVEQVGPTVVGHVPEVLQIGERGLMDWVKAAATMTWFPAVTKAHLARLGSDARVEPGPSPGLNRIEYPLTAMPRVSIIIPTRNHFSILQKCIESLMGNTQYANYELLIVDNNSDAQDARKFLNELEALGSDQITVLRYPETFDFSKINNFAVRHARGDLLLFLNNDIEVTDPAWLSAMVSHALRPEVAVVGARLSYANGRVQHAGLILGLENSVGFAFQGVPGDQPGYMSRLQLTHNVSAVSGACMMIRRDVFDELGGFDEASFSVYYGDVDLALRARQAGYLTVYTPEVHLNHLGGATRLLTDRFGVPALPDDDDRDRLYEKWLPQLAADPAYHPAYGKRVPGFDLSPDAARIHTPLPGRPLPVVLASHTDWEGCGHYRIIQPYQALEGALQLEGGLKLGNFHFTDVARILPDVIVLQGSWANEGILKQIERYQQVAGAKVVLEFDDYLPNIPVQNIHRKKIPQSFVAKMRRAMERVDWLVVSTSALAEEYATFHPEIRVAQNGLYAPWWKGLESARRTGRKPRVGWAGGSSHTGDLAVIRALVMDMKDEIEWVFMGMRPKDVVCEFHPGVSIEQYPKRLASLNLDLAVVPLEINQFNRCKSNLRLLELGACGVPVICTDIEPYRCGLPVTLVRNRYQDWAEAIRSHLSDLDATAKRGDELRDAVLRDWVLEGGHLNQWIEAWLPKA